VDNINIQRLLPYLDDVIIPEDKRRANTPTTQRLLSHISLSSSPKSYLCLLNALDETGQSQVSSVLRDSLPKGKHIFVNIFNIYLSYD